MAWGGGSHVWPSPAFGGGSPLLWRPETLECMVLPSPPSPSLHEQPKIRLVCVCFIFMGRSLPRTLKSWLWVKLRPAVMSGLTVDYTNFRGFDRWLCCISAVDCWLHPHYALWHDNNQQSKWQLHAFFSILHIHSCNYEAYWNDLPLPFALICSGRPAG